MPIKLFVIQPFHFSLFPFQFLRNFISISVLIQGGGSFIHFLFCSCYWGILDGRDLVLNHRSHWVNLEWFRFLWLLLLLFENLMILDWGWWLRVLGSISNYGWVCFDCGLVHGNFLFFLLLLFSFLLCFFCWFFSILLIGLFVSLLIFLGSGLLAISLLGFFFGCLFIFFFILSGRRLGGISLFSILLHVFSEWLNKVISEGSVDFNCLWLLHIASSQQSCKDKCSTVLH